MGDRDPPETGASLSTRLLPGIPDSLSRETFLFLHALPSLHAPPLLKHSLCCLTVRPAHWLPCSSYTCTYSSHLHHALASSLHFPAPNSCAKGTCGLQEALGGARAAGLALPPASPGSPNAEAVCESPSGAECPQATLSTFHAQVPGELIPPFALPCGRGFAESRHP